MLCVVFLMTHLFTLCSFTLPHRKCCWCFFLLLVAAFFLSLSIPPFNFLRIWKEAAVKVPACDPFSHFCCRHILKVPQSLLSTSTSKIDTKPILIRFATLLRIGKSICCSPLLRLPLIAFCAWLGVRLLVCWRFQLCSVAFCLLRAISLKSNATTVTFTSHCQSCIAPQRVSLCGCDVFLFFFSLVFGARVFPLFFSDFSISPSLSLSPSRFLFFFFSLSLQ
jgi:hypothetical protein